MKKCYNLSINFIVVIDFCSISILKRKESRKYYDSSERIDKK